MADPVLLEQFDERSDLNPNEEEHSAYLTLMPEQGIPLEVAIRMQINVLYRPLTRWVDILADAPPMFYPAVWFEVTTELPPHMAGQLNMLDKWVPLFGDIFGYSFIVIGNVVALTGIGLVLRAKRSILA